MKPHRAAIVAATLLLLLLAGCGDDGGDRLTPNQAPSVRISGGPPEEGESSYLTTVWWSGWDEDGTIDLYEYAVDPPAAFDLAEISDPVGSGLDVTVILGPFPGTDTLEWGKGVDGERVTFRYVQTGATGRSFRFSTPDPDSAEVDGETQAIPRFSGYHVLYVRARDDRGAYSPADRLAYTAVTATPSSHLQRFWSESVVFAGPTIQFNWDGSDPDHPGGGKPIGYLTKLVELSALSPPIRVDLAIPEFIMYRHPEASRIPWTYRPGDSRSLDLTLKPPATYLFAVRAVDIAGAVEPFLDKTRNGGPGNAVAFQGQSSWGTPTLQVMEPALGDVDGGPNGARGLLTTEFEVPVGLGLRFTWSGSAASYGGFIDAYDWGVDLESLDGEDGSGWHGWTTLTANPEPIGFDAPGNHYVYFRVRDEWGNQTRLMVILHVIEMPRDRGVLFVDDFKDEVYPRDNEHDDFWLKMLTDSERFSPDDLDSAVWKYDVHGTNDVLYTFPDPPSLSLLSRYSMIFWANRGTGYNGNTGLTRTRRDLGLCVSTGTGLWISGEATAAAMLPTSTGISNFEYPLKATPGTFPWTYLKMYMEEIHNDKGYDLRTNGLIEVDPYPGQPEIWPGLVRDDSKVRESLRGSGTHMCDAIFDPILTSREPDFRGVLEPLYVYGANGPRRVDRTSRFEGKLNALRFHDPDPDPVHGPTVWFGFPMYYWYDDQAQAVVNGVIDWFREVAPTP